MLGLGSHLTILLVLEACDMRKSYDGLSAIAEAMAAERLREGAMFVFTNKRRNRFKALYYDRSGILLYKLESDLRNTRAGPALRAAIRASHATPMIHRLEEIFKLLHRRHRPSSPLGQALSYALSPWPDTQAYLDDGLVEIDNNLVENRIRPLKIGKKNSLFFGSAGAGYQYAIGYPIAETVKKYGLDLRSYMVEAISQLAMHGPQVAEQITPRSLTEPPKAILAKVKKTA